MRTFRLREGLADVHKARSDDRLVEYRLPDGRLRRQELADGTGFLTQAGRYIIVGKDVKAAEAISSKGIRRKVK
jgi:hypothetical protein